MTEKYKNVKKRGPHGPSKYTQEFIEDLADKLIEWMKNPSNFWLGDFATDNGMWRARLEEFAVQNAKFSSAYKQAKQLQESKLVKGALGKKIDTTMAIFALKNVSGFRDRAEQVNVNIDGDDQKFRNEFFGIK